jgi:hypothetical protein
MATIYYLNVHFNYLKKYLASLFHLIQFMALELAVLLLIWIQNNILVNIP